MKFSHSKVEIFKICPFKYWLSYVQNLDTLPSDDPQNALIVGTCMHECIEKGLNSGISMYKKSFNCMGNLHYVEIKKKKKLAPQVDNFINKLNEVNTKVIIRVVIIPGINDTKEYMNDLKKYISKIKNIVTVEFLPFHTLGFSKYIEYNIENPFKNIEAMSNEKCNELYKYFSKL